MTHGLKTGENLTHKMRKSITAVENIIVYNFPFLWPGNLEEPVLQADHMFCDTAKTVHEQFNNCSSLRSVTLR